MRRLIQTQFFRLLETSSQKPASENNLDHALNQFAGEMVSLSQAESDFSLLLRIYAFTRARLNSLLEQTLVWGTEKKSCRLFSQRSFVAD